MYRSKAFRYLGKFIQNGYPDIGLELGSILNVSTFNFFVLLVIIKAAENHWSK
jgi:hypothetical protein